MDANKSQFAIVGIVGGIASGKTFVAKQLAARGAVVIDADQLGHAVLEEPDVQRAISGRWGREVTDENGLIDRAKIAKIVFADTPRGAEELRYLEGLTHPRIKQRVLDELKRLKAQGVQVVVLDAPVLLEAGWDKLCERIVYVEAPRDVRLGRALARGWTKEDFERREKVQDSLNTKRQAADLVIDNSASPEASIVQIDRLWPQLLAGPPPAS